MCYKMRNSFVDSRCYSNHVNLLSYLRAFTVHEFHMYDVLVAELWSIIEKS